MASIINASSSSGVVTTADNSGQLVIQTNGVTALTIDSSQNVTIPKAFTTTQASGDNSTAIATTAFVNSATKGLGFGGTTWATTSNYSNGVVYTNSNAYPIALSVSSVASYGGAGQIIVRVNGYDIGNNSANNGGQAVNQFVIVPPSGTYQVVGNATGAWILQ